ncbi:adenylate/guanylate cyclase domain-containing protein [Streptomyces sp. NPDC048362]|uniref:adenylate/guanylate cyclase domain-containing protein n=1 Tax=Streptomyces sp. NPDC048362 TaxID=3365539 RepID=UPI0037192438
MLVVDDDGVNRMLMAKLVQRLGHDVQEARDGLEAYEILNMMVVDIVLLDLEMPVLDGFAVLERIKENSKLREIPVVVVSAVEDIDSVVRAIELGADDYVSKPVNRTLLQARLGASLERRMARKLEQEHVRSMFSRFVPESVAAEIMANLDGSLRLGGERRIATVLFSDLRSFTPWAEINSPERVIEVLNRYLSLMTDVVLDHGGTLVSYMGDGIMALFGAPIETESHGDLALAAAKAMSSEALSEFNSWLGGPGFRMGIGINSGPVMSGNVGSDRRLEYTAVGDTVNTASRLEQMTKKCGHMVLLSEETRSGLLYDPGDLMSVGQIVLRGKKNPTTVWAVTSSDGT